MTITNIQIDEIIRKEFDSPQICFPMYMVFYTGLKYGEYVRGFIEIDHLNIVDIEERINLIR